MGAEVGTSHGYRGMMYEKVSDRHAARARVASPERRAQPGLAFRPLSRACGRRRRAVVGVGCSLSVWVVGTAVLPAAGRDPGAADVHRAAAGHGTVGVVVLLP